MILIRIRNIPELLFHLPRHVRCKATHGTDGGRSIWHEEQGAEAILTTQHTDLHAHYYSVGHVAEALRGNPGQMIDRLT
ncbi:hypothetical protein E2C01_056694 [Portunus trituberculatus]|uniref:Uncharacterized protein n=1 Tax=Portunus trituberculatus TaxID=210409 RepID=A0A5B7GZU5_PORTR|nr:hypothetical protein [Portunus trituberculatus]